MRLLAYRRTVVSADVVPARHRKVDALRQQPATIAEYADRHRGAGWALPTIQADREKLTSLLRDLAAELDELDRQVSDLLWRARRSGDRPAMLSALESRREQLTGRLRSLARQLTHLDHSLAAVRGSRPDLAAVGICPHCGYPSLGSGLCAYCRPYLVG